MKRWTGLAAVGSLALMVLEGSVVLGLVVEHYTGDALLAALVAFGVALLALGGVFELMLRED